MAIVEGITVSDELRGKKGGLPLRVSTGLLMWLESSGYEENEEDLFADELLSKMAGGRKRPRRCHDRHV